MLVTFVVWIVLALTTNVALGEPINDPCHRYLIYSAIERPRDIVIETEFNEIIFELLELGYTKLSIAHAIVLGTRSLSKHNDNEHYVKYDTLLFDVLLFTEYTKCKETGYFTRGNTTL